MVTITLSQSSFNSGIPSLSSDTTYVLSENVVISNRFTSIGTNVVFDGNDHTITINDVADFLGLFNSYIDVRNLGVLSSGTTTLANQAGWFFVSEINALATDCYSTGNISEEGGGIFGRGAGRTNVDSVATRCYSTGTISTSAGGIFGSYAGFDVNGRAYANNCYSTGDIGVDAGGIFGKSSAHGNGINSIARADTCYSTGNISNGGGGIFGALTSAIGISSTVRCYSTGNIGPGAGGIFGRYSSTGGAGQSSFSTATNCYSTGTIQAGGGGIFGEYSGHSGGTATTINCYSSGVVSSTGAGIFGASSGTVNGTVVIQNCYTSGQNTNPLTYYVGPDSIRYTITNTSHTDVWSDTDANLSLTGYPGITPQVWYSWGINTPYRVMPSPTPSIPSTPSGLTVTNLLYSNRLIWNLAEYTYNIYRSWYLQGPYVMIGTTSTNQYDDGNVTNGKTYYYYITATDGINTSLPSNIVYNTYVGPIKSQLTSGLRTAQIQDVTIAISTVPRGCPESLRIKQRKGNQNLYTM